MSTFEASDCTLSNRRIYYSLSRCRRSTWVEVSHWQHAKPLDAARLIKFNEVLSLHSMNYMPFLSNETFPVSPTAGTQNWVNGMMKTVEVRHSRKNPLAAFLPRSELRFSARNTFFFYLPLFRNHGSHLFLAKGHDCIYFSWENSTRSATYCIRTPSSASPSTKTFVGRLMVRRFSKKVLFIATPLSGGSRGALWGNCVSRKWRWTTMMEEVWTKESEFHPSD